MEISLRFFGLSLKENQFVYSGGDSNKSEIPDVNHDVLFREGITSQVDNL